MVIRLFFLCLLLFFFNSNVFTQSLNFGVSLEEISIENSPSLHSGAYAKWDNKWILIGGRTNGLHGFLPPFAFPSSGINNAIYIVDPLNNQTISTSTNVLPNQIEEAITCSNMQFYQQDSILYMLGGYGWSDSINDFRTFNTLTIIDIPSLVSNIEQQVDINACFRQISDSVLAVCGGALQKIDSTFYLVFGHKFDGRYDQKIQGGFFTQEYTNQIRTFKLQDDGVNALLIDYNFIEDTSNFHRRDYNLVPQFFNDNSYGFTAFSGVFQYGINIPYFNLVDITPFNYSVNDSFYHHLANYHCAVMPLYDGNTMHTVFFGGSSMYYIDSISNSMLLDSLVPFVNTISVVSRYADGTIIENSLSNKMPGLLGTNAYFIPNENITLQGGIIDLNNFSSDSLHVGYIIGGIKSPMPNISKIDASMSEASSHIYKVYIQNTVNIDEYDTPIQFTCYPNPTSDNIIIDIVPYQESKIEIYNSKGVLLQSISSESEKTYINTIELKNGIYLVKVGNKSYTAVKKVMVIN